MDKLTAERIINALDSGVVSYDDVDYFNIGRSNEIAQIETLLRNTKKGDSNILFVHGDYGVGKTHILNLTKEKALRDKFVVSYVTLSSRECPLSKMVWVYGDILKNMSFRAENENLGLLSFLDMWLELVENRISKYRNDQCKHKLTYLTCGLGCIDELYKEHMPELEKINETLKNAIKLYQYAFLRGNDELKVLIIRWILGEKLKRIDFNYINNQLKGIEFNENIDYSNAFDMFKSISSLSKILGYSGFIILLDEAERIPSIGNVLEGYTNLCRIIIQSSMMPGVLIVYATTPQFYEDAKNHFKYYESEGNKELLETIYRRMEKERLILTILKEGELLNLAKKVIKIYIQSMGDHKNSEKIFNNILNEITVIIKESTTMREYIAKALPLIKKS